MLNALIGFSLRHRPLVLLCAGLLLLFGGWAARELPIEVLPDLTKPTVTILTECPGLAPEEVEALVTLPIEAGVLGVSRLDRVRSSSDVGLSLVFAEFRWGTDLFTARQWVQERLQAVRERLPSEVNPGLTPVSSLMGEILLVGIRSTDGALSPQELRTLADTTIRRRLQSLPGVADVLSIGGGVQQIHVLPDPQRMAAHHLHFEDIEEVVARAAGNTTSGYFASQSREIMVRNVAMTLDPVALRRTAVKSDEDHVVPLSEVALVEVGVQPMRGDASVNGHPGVILSVDKAPGFDTLRITRQVEAALEELAATLPGGVEATVLFRQGDFIEHAIGNLREAIRDGAIMVAVVLFLFLLNVRTTGITLAAIPLSFAVSALVFYAMDVSVNSMTLGGLAVAMGMVVDDAIVDVENVFRRLRENAASESPRSVLDVVASASAEVRHSILYATLLVLLVFVPLLGLAGLEGRIFTPIAVATMTSMAASFVVSLTVIPVLCSFLLEPRAGHSTRDAWLVRWLKRGVELTALRLALARPFAVFFVVALGLAAATALIPRMGRDFLPAFNEGSATISLASAPGTSLYESNQIGETAVKLLQEIPEIRSIGRRAGRAERDDHVMPVSVNEFDIEFHEGGRPRGVVFAEIREKLGTIPGTFAAVGAPIAHRLSHMLSGVSAKVAVKIFGPDLDELRFLGKEVERLARATPGLTDVLLEPQVPIPQVRVEVDRERAFAYGVKPQTVNEQLAHAVGGRTVAQLRDGQRLVDVVVRLPERWRDSPEKIAQTPIRVPGHLPLPAGLFATVRETVGPNVIHRENAQRRTVVSANTNQRDLEGVVRQLEEKVRAGVRLPPGYHIRFEGEFQAQQSATRRIVLLFAVVLGAVAFLLHAFFRSAILAAQVFINIPLALLGGIVATWWLVGNISIATLIGFIAVGGIAARNAIMMLSHYLHLMKHEGEDFSRAMVIRGTQERLVPVLMTALSAGIALLPLALTPDAPGREILQPVAVVIVGGLISSTLLDLVVTPAAFFAFSRAAAAKSLRLGAPAAH
jgi:CzcA family heavy metal efflux pump